jgi:predicted acylesterase/phospholipase RssA
MSDPKLKDKDRQLVEKTWKILRKPGGDPQALYELAIDLKNGSRFGMARRLLERAREDRDRQIESPAFSLLLRQQHALCTYKDPDLPRHVALDRALKILNHEGDLDRTENQETLGLAGAIYKRRWQVDARKSNLERSLAYYYERGHKPAAEIRAKALAGQALPDKFEVALQQIFQGYTSINAAFVLDVLADIEEREAREAGAKAMSANERRQLSDVVRKELVETMPQLIEKGLLEKNWWALATIAEAHFGLGEYDEARKIFAIAKEQKHETWMLESTAQQLANIASIQRQLPVQDQDKRNKWIPEKSEAWRIVSDLLGGDDEAVRSLFFGKLGLALSGGGFRASLFHLGVLARLAEQDLLRHVHVLSCVSGGSIVGAHYYLEIRNLLKTKWDQHKDGRKPEEVLSRDDYIELVDRLITDFVSGVERNLRIRVAGSFIGNLKMAFLPNYSRTDRLGELFEEELFSKVKDSGGKKRRKRYLDELLILPREFESTSGATPTAFRPKSHNWKRRNKVPMLVLNATSLNTGHNWQFTSTWMGESPFSIDEDIDGNWRLRRMWYSEAPDAYKPPNGPRRIRLGKAVGASACVPGLFEPVALPELYPKDSIGGKHDEMTVRLVDGGVHDNQGVASLLEQDCDVLIVSDASGQMTSQPDPGSGILATVLRTNSVLMERVRQAQFQDLKARLQGGLLKGLMVMHLKKGLEVDPVDWKECEEPPDVPFRKRSELLNYGILRNMQELLAGVRTDLDSFSEVESHALMTSGYLMASHYVDALGEFPRMQVSDDQRHSWSFLDVESPLYTRGDSRKAQRNVERMLEVASQKAFKIWSLSTPLKVLAWILRIALAAGFIWLWWKYLTSLWSKSFRHTDSPSP